MSHTMSRVVLPRVSAGAISISVHAAVVLALLLAAAVVVPQPPTQPPHRVDIKLKLRAPVLVPQQEESGGGADSEEPARKGKLPDARPPRVYIPPRVAINEHPALPVQVAMMGLPDLNVNLPQIGDPFSTRDKGGLGIGKIPGGIGDGPGGKGVGPGSESGLNRSAVALSTKVTRQPLLLYKVEPQYSEPARKAHVQGYVRLRVDVGLDGKPINIRVLQGIGMGLDEAAIDAVKQWRFQPAVAGDQPVVAPATIEVGFHLI